MFDISTFDASTFDANAFQNDEAGISGGYGTRKKQRDLGDLYGPYRFRAPEPDQQEISVRELVIIQSEPTAPLAQLLLDKLIAVPPPNPADELRAREIKRQLQMMRDDDEAVALLLLN